MSFTNKNTAVIESVCCPVHDMGMAQYVLGRDLTEIVGSVHNMRTGKLPGSLGMRSYIEFDLTVQASDLHGRL